jgi:hypothetical protein
MIHRVSVEECLPKQIPSGASRVHSICPLSLYDCGISDDDPFYVPTLMPRIHVGSMCVGCASAQPDSRSHLGRSSPSAWLVASVY